MAIILNHVSVIVQQMEIYRKDHLIFGQKDGDTGDGAQRTGLFYGLSRIALEGITSRPLPLYKSDMDRLEVSPGVFRRSDVPNFWGNNPNNLSRDQLSVLKTAMAINGDTERLARTFKAQLKRGMLHQNTHNGEGIRRIPDVPTLAEYGVFIRGMDLWYLKPVLWLTDFDLLISTLTRQQNLWDADNMLAFQMLYANMKYPTWISKFARYIYKKTNYQYRIQYYYRETDGNNGLKPLGDLYDLVIKEKL